MYGSGIYNIKKIGIPEDIKIYENSLNFKNFFKKATLPGIFSNNKYTGISPFTDLSECDNYVEKYLTKELKKI